MKLLEYRCPWCGELFHDPSKIDSTRLYFTEFDHFAVKSDFKKYYIFCGKQKIGEGRIEIDQR
ncbi:MAG: hypothetical protein PUC65_06610 [Clostridiales bacterium]|nr:hypothetical protein [Clostridiales bacterium]